MTWLAQWKTALAETIAYGVHVLSRCLERAGCSSMASDVESDSAARSTELVQAVEAMKTEAHRLIGPDAASNLEQAVRRLPPSASIYADVVSSLSFEIEPRLWGLPVKLQTGPLQVRLYRSSEVAMAEALLPEKPEKAEMPARCSIHRYGFIGYRLVCLGDNLVDAAKSLVEALARLGRRET